MKRAEERRKVLDWEVLIGFIFDNEQTAERESYLCRNHIYAKNEQETQMKHWIQQKHISKKI